MPNGSAGCLRLNLDYAEIGITKNFRSRGGTHPQAYVHKGEKLAFCDRIADHRRGPVFLRDFNER